MLRAAAIVLALCFHAGFSFASRGYVSLDIFFVISGYVITNQIAEETEKRKFSLVRFYERRMRRLLPALFAVLVFTLIVGCFLLPPFELSRLALSATSVTLFFSNFFFQNEGWYFDTAAYLKPLLHLWSLSVEEQFYFFFPVMFVLSARWGKKACVGLIALVAAFSFSLYLVDFFQFTQSTFYQLPWRAWEMLLGSLVSLLSTQLNAIVFVRKWRQWLYWAGVLIIALSVFLIHPATENFFNMYCTRIFAAIGTAMTILFMAPYSGHLTGPQKILVYIGLVSYGAYLWHQPLFAFYRIYTFGNTVPVVFFLLIGISLGLGYLSWRFIEIPVRSSQKLNTRKVYVYSGAAIALIAGISYVMHSSGGFPQRLSSKVQSALREISDERNVRFTKIKIGVCHFNSKNISLDDFLKNWNCYADNADGNKKIPIAVTGDSLSTDVVAGLRSNGLNPLQLAGAGCAIAPDGMSTDCRAITDRLLSELKRHSEYKAIVLVTEFREESNLDSVKQAVGYWKQSGLKIVLLAGNFSFPFFNHKILRGIEPTLDQAHANQSMRPELVRYLRENDIYVIDSRYYFCAINDCHLRDGDGHLILFDEKHMTLTGSKKYLEILLKEDPFFKSLRAGFN